MPPKSSVHGRAPQSQPSVGNKQVPLSSSRFAFTIYRAFLVFAVFNTIGALFSPIQDCDETYNYWEPAHYLLHGYGRQTWEYSPDFAIRDWLYVALHAATAGIGGLVIRLIFLPLQSLPMSARTLLADHVHEIILGGKIAEFYALRLALGMLAAGCQARFVTAIQRTLNPRVAVFTGMIMVSSPGFFHATPAFLPSSFAMCMSMLGAAAFMDWKMGMGGGAMSHGSNAGIMWFGTAALLGWPFAGALILPFLVEEVIVAVIAEDKVELARRWADGLTRVMILVVFQLGVNLFFYHKWLVVPLNIVLYNVFGGEGRGPEIFGTEPADFYLKNLALNFNVWLSLGLITGPIIILQWLVTERGQSKYLLMRSLFFVAPFYLWLAIFSAQPHKEERFMYPAYPFLALNAAISLHGILGIVGNADKKTLIGMIPPQVKFLFVSAAVIFAIDLGAFRTAGTMTAYRAPMRIYNALYTRPALQLSGNEIVCLGKEWYRFPASFFLPDGVHVKFVRSAFNGLLPGEFNEAGTGFGFFPGTWLVPPGMNDINEFDPGKLIDLRRCDYMVDSYRPGDLGSMIEPNYAADKDDWEELQCERFMDADRTHLLGRLLWLPDDLPIIPERFRRQWNQFCLLKRKKSSM